MGTWTYKYNLFGELLYQRDAKHNCAVMTYDDLGRMTSRKYWINGTSTCSTGENGGQSTWVYDNTSTSPSFGLMLQEYNNKVKKDYFFDGFARVDTTVTTLVGEGEGGVDAVYTESHFYDQYSRSLAHFDATGESVRFTYSNTGYQHNTIDQTSGIVLSTVENIDAYGNIKQFSVGNGVSTTNSYDNLGRLTTISTTQGNTNIQGLTYAYDDVGNLESRIDTRGLEVFFEQFTYDDVNRLKTVKARTDNLPLITTMDFDYDAGGRMTMNNGQVYQYISGPVHGVNAVGNKSYTYDANGNQVDSDGRTMEYSPFNKVEHMYQGGTSVSFDYDHNNERFKRVDVGSDENETTYYVGNVEFMIKANGTTVAKRYVGDAVIARYSDNINKVTYLHRDHLGSVQTVSSQNFSDLTIEHLSFMKYIPVFHPFGAS